jgi:hypothetical protein
MTQLRETRFREHVALLRQAARGIGADVEGELKNVETKISRSSKTAGRDAEVLAHEIHLDLARIAVSVSKGSRNLPTNLKKGAVAAGGLTKRGLLKAAGETKAAGKAVKKSTKKELAKAAGIYHEPPREWVHPVDQPQ